MASEKLSNDQKRSIAKVNPSGELVEDVRIIAKVKSKSTIYKAKREGQLLNKLDSVEKSNRQLVTENEILKSLNNKLASENKSLKQQPIIFFSNSSPR